MSVWCEAKLAAPEYGGIHSCLLASGHVAPHRCSCGHTWELEHEQCDVIFGLHACELPKGHPLPHSVTEPGPRAPAPVLTGPEIMMFLERAERIATALEKIERHLADLGSCVWEIDKGAGELRVTR